MLAKIQALSCLQPLTLKLSLTSRNGVPVLPSCLAFLPNLMQVN